MKEIIITAPDLWNWSDVRHIRVGNNVDWFGSDLEIEFINWETEWYNLKTNWQ